MSSSTLALGRALTKRIRRENGPSTPSHPRPPHPNGGPIIREQISAPVELLSTTNVLAYTAPDIRSLSNSSSSSLSSSDDWDLTRAFLNTPSTSPEPSSAEASPTTTEPEPNHLTSYFNTPIRSSTTAGMNRKSNSSTDLDVPAIPSRSLTHTKKAHVALARHRSLSRSRSDLPPISLTNTVTHRTSTEMFNSSEGSHPFGRELEQVNEVAEDFGVSDSVLDEEEQLLRRKGLKKFGVVDYMMEIEDLYGGVFEDKLTQTAWI
jgi:hypothetical protein